MRFVALAILFMFSTVVGRSAMVRDQNLTGDFIVESPDWETSNTWVQRWSGIRDRLVSLLGLTGVSNQLLLLRVVPKLPDGDRVRFHAWVSHGKLDFCIEVTDPLDVERFLLEASKVLIYQRILPADKVWKSGESLPEIPLWVMLGVSHYLRFEDEDLTEKIIKRMSLIKKAPSLSTILKWSDVSLNELEMEYQRVFSYALLFWQTRDPQKNETFWKSMGTSQYKQWMAEIDQDESKEKWSRFLSSFRIQEKPLLSWEETQRATSNLLYLAVPVVETEGEGEEKKEVEKTVLVAWDQLESVKDRERMLSVLQVRINDLIRLESEAHFAWRAFLFNYRVGLQMLAEQITTEIEAIEKGKRPPDPRKQKISYTVMVSAAKEELDDVQKRLSGITDYLDWFVVSHQSEEDRFAFENYFEEIGRIKKMEVKGKDPFRQQSAKIEERKD